MQESDALRQSTATGTANHRLPKLSHGPRGRATVLESVDAGVAGIVALGGLFVLIAIWRRMRRRRL
jgi:hypothetical protein